MDIAYKIAYIYLATMGQSPTKATGATFIITNLCLTRTGVLLTTIINKIQQERYTIISMKTHLLKCHFDNDFTMKVQYISYYYINIFH